MKAGHLMQDIPNYSFLQFMAFAKIAERQEALRRDVFVQDLLHVVSAMHAKPEDKTLTEHLTSLHRIHTEEE